MIAGPFKPKTLKYKSSLTWKRNPSQKGMELFFKACIERTWHPGKLLEALPSLGASVSWTTIRQD